MISSVSFMSKQWFATRLKANSNIVVISIGDDQDPAPRVMGRGFGGLLRLEFHDMYEESSGFEVGDFPDLHKNHANGVRLFSYGYEISDLNDARKILKFINYYVNADKNVELVVHCQAGVSRSAAVAQFCADKFGIPITGNNRDTSQANARLLRLLNKANNNEPAAIFDMPDKKQNSSITKISAGTAFI